MSSQNYSGEDPFLRDQEQELAHEDYFDDCDNPLTSGPTSENFISPNLDYEDRDADGNPKMKKIERTWGQWVKHWKPLFFLTLFALLKTLSSTLIGPLIPFLLVEYYGGTKEAVKEAAEVQTYFDAGRALLAFFIVPMYGKLLDTVGRRPFFILAAILSTLPPAFLFAVPRNPIYYIIANEVCQIFSGSYQFAFIADCFEERERAKAFAIMTGVSGLGTFIAIGVPNMKEDFIFTLSVIIIMCRIPLAFGFIRETLPRAQRKKFQLHLLNPNPLPCIRLIANQPLLRKLTIIISMLVVTAVAAGEVMMFYLIERVHMVKADGAYSALESGLLMPLMLLVLFPILSKWVRPTRMVFISFVMMILGIVALMAIQAKWMFFALVLPLLLGIEIGVPSLIGMFANAGEKGSQGMRMAGISAVMDLIKAFTPLIAGAIFRALPSDLNFLTFGIALVASIPAVPMVWFQLPKWVAADRDEQIMKSFSAGSSNIAGDEAGDPDKRELTVQEIARQAAEEAEGKSPLV